MQINFIQCDLASLVLVKAAAQSFIAASDRLDILYCNAGIMAVPPGVSKEGYEIQFSTNHVSAGAQDHHNVQNKLTTSKLGHALLVKLLLPTLLNTASQPNSDVRIINMTSIAYQQAPKSGIEFSTLRSSQDGLGGAIPGGKWSRYGQSKLANMLYPMELAKRHPSITSVSVHPGVILTGLFDNLSFATRLPVMISSMGKRTPVEKGHFNQTWAGTCPKSQLKNGEYYEPIGVVGKRTTKAARNSKLAEQLWEWTQKELAAYD